MEGHTNISDDNIQKNLIDNLSSDPRIHNEWIANFLKRYADVTQEIEYLQKLLAVMDDNENREKVTESQNKKGKRRDGITGPQSLAQTVSYRYKAMTTYFLNKEEHLHAKER